MGISTTSNGHGTSSAAKEHIKMVKKLEDPALQQIVIPLIDEICELTKMGVSSIDANIRLCGPTRPCGLGKTRAVEIYIDHGMIALTSGDRNLKLRETFTLADPKSIARMAKVINGFMDIEPKVKPESAFKYQYPKTGGK